MRQRFKIEDSLRKINFDAEHALNMIEHYAYGEKDAKQRVVIKIQIINESIKLINDELLNEFLFKDE